MVDGNRRFEDSSYCTSLDRNKNLDDVTSKLVSYFLAPMALFQTARWAAKTSSLSAWYP